MSNFLKDLAERTRFGVKPGLETIRRIANALGEPQKQLGRVIHIAGTNGKGAVAALLDAALRKEGSSDFPVARYTSPHLVRINERFFLNGRPVEDAALEAAAEKVAAVETENLTFFEALTATAFTLFAEAHCRWTILETGLGGRLDATNICEPTLTIITRIGLDHCDWLGDTMEKIAVEKAGIIKSGIPVVLGENLPSVRAVIEQRARELNAPFYYAPQLIAKEDLPEKLPLPGAFNRENLRTALAALKVLDLTDQILFPESVIWPGRFQWVEDKFLIDGAHNPPAATALAAALGELVPPRRFHLIAGFCADKDIDETLRILSPFVNSATAVKTHNPRSLSADEVAKKMRGANIAASCATSLEAALAERRKAVDGLPTLIAGSLFLAGEALVLLNAYPWGEARFDPSEKFTPALRPVSAPRECSLS